MATNDNKQTYELMLDVPVEEPTGSFLVQFMRDQEHKAFVKQFRGTIGFLSTLPKDAAEVIADKVDTLVSQREYNELQADFNKQAKALAEATGARKAEQDPKELKRQRDEARAEAKALRDGLAAMAESVEMSVPAFIKKFSDASLEDIDIKKIRREAQRANRLVARLEKLQDAAE